MATFGFRFRFQVPSGLSFRRAHPKRRIRLPGDAGRVYLRKLARPRQFRFTHVPDYELSGSQFSSQADSKDCATRLKNALLLFAAQGRIGLNAGKDPATTSASTEVRRICAEQGIQLRDNVLGVDVFAEEPRPMWVGVSATGTTSRVIDDYEPTLYGLYERKFVWTPKQHLALELYNLAHFENAPKVRFLALVTVAEVLAERPMQSERVRALLEEFRALVEKAVDLSPDEKDRLSDGVGNLKRESISGACRDLVAAYGTAEDTKYFAKCYGLRSKLVHEGVMAEPFDPARLDELVSRLLVGHLTQNP